MNNHVFETVYKYHTDSCGYTKETLSTCGTDVYWISRVPATLKSCYSAIEATYDQWKQLAEGYQYVPLSSTYAGVAQRWLLVHSEEAYAREILVLRKKYLKDSTREQQALEKLKKTAFASQQTAQKAIDQLAESCQYLSISDINIVAVGFFDKKGRPKKDAKPDGYHYYVAANPSCSLDTFANMANTKGKFIIATNQTDSQQLPDDLFFKYYKGQAKVERGFRFLKDPQFIASTLFVKKPERVEALLFIMTLCLSVYAAIEFKIRQALKQQDLTFPNQLKKQVNNPTARWIFACFTPVQVLYVNHRPQILNLNDLHRKVIGLLGNAYRKYYMLL